MEGTRGSAVVVVLDDCAGGVGGVGGAGVGEMDLAVGGAAAMPIGVRITRKDGTHWSHQDFDAAAESESGRMYGNWLFGH